MWEIRFLPVFIKGLLYTGLGICLWFATSLSKNQRLAQKKKNRSFHHDSFHCFFPVYAQEQIPPVTLRSVALYKKATVSDSLLSLFKKERFAQKTKEWIPNPGYHIKDLISNVLYYTTASTVLYIFTTIIIIAGIHHHK